MKSTFIERLDLPFRQTLVTFAFALSFLLFKMYIFSFQLLKQERIKDYLLMEEEFIRNQERLKPQEEKIEEERAKVDDLRGTPMSVGR